ncbi:MAG: hypothetical protein EBX52_01525 [Proteobacteria bacterium]|nr:hypothetical protein [Pseudomonadota bacterium]
MPAPQGSFIYLFLLVFITSCSSFAIGRRHTNPEGPVKISFLLTNDLHGHLAPDLTYLAAITRQLRALPEYRDEKSALLVLDAGDQFQGTLLSNYNEGRSMFQMMNRIGYDAVIPGNHDYDFGPLGWLFDQVTPGSTSNNPREVIEGLARSADFPLLSANTYLKTSILSGGKSLALDAECKPANASPVAPLDFAAARQPGFLTPYRIFTRAGVRIAVIGLDNHATSSTTTKENVSDLCFRDEAETYLEIRRSLEGKADLFVALMHNGDTDQATDATGIARKINAAMPDGVALVAAGHTHALHDHVEAGVHVIQDGANARAYGRVDLFYDPGTRRVLKEKTLAAAGIPLKADTCPMSTAAFACSQLRLPLASDPEADKIIEKAMRDVAPLAKRKLGIASDTIWVSRTDESPLANQLTDALRIASNADVALLNTGGIRAPLRKGEILYENLFETLPIQNQAVLIANLPWTVLKSALLASAKTCGRYGALMQSGLKIRFRRDCTRATDQLDSWATLVSVQTLDGTVLLDTEKGIETPPETSFAVATLDFLASGGSGYTMLGGSSVSKKIGIFREIVSETWLKFQPEIEPRRDGRFRNENR